MQRRKTGKISIFSSLDVIFDSLASRVGNSNRVSIRGRYQAGSECWNRVFKPNQKVGTEYSSRVRRLVSKLDPTVSLIEYERKSEMSDETSWLQATSWLRATRHCEYRQHSDYEWFRTEYTYQYDYSVNMKQNTRSKIQEVKHKK